MAQSADFRAFKKPQSIQQQKVEVRHTIVNTISETSMLGLLQVSFFVRRDTTFIEPITYRSVSPSTLKTHTLKGDSSFSKDSNFLVHDFSQLKVQKYSNSNEIFYGINISPYTGEFDASLRKGFTKDQGRIIMFCKFKRKSLQGE